MSAVFATLLYLKFDFKIYHIIFHVESNNWDNYLQPMFYFAAVIMAYSVWYNYLLLKAKQT